LANHTRPPVACHLNEILDTPLFASPGKMNILIELIRMTVALQEAVKITDNNE